MGFFKKLDQSFEVNGLLKKPNRSLKYFSQEKRFPTKTRAPETYISPSSSIHLVRGNKSRVVQAESQVETLPVTVAYGKAF